jgi:hypothetical protein
MGEIPNCTCADLPGMRHWPAAINLISDALGLLTNADALHGT